MSTQRLELRRAEKRIRAAERIVRVGQGAQQQRLAQGEHVAGLVEQAAQERRADVAAVEDEMEWPRLAHAAAGLGDRGARQPGALRRGREDPVVEEARVAVLRARRGAGRARGRPQGRGCGDRRPARPATAPRDRGRRCSVARRACPGIVARPPRPKKSGGPKAAAKIAVKSFSNRLRSPPWPARTRSDRGRRRSAGRCCRCRSCRPSR